MQFERVKNQQRDVDVNLTPLIDVVFLLLIFLMVSTSFIKETHLAINLPKAVAAVEPPVEENALEVLVDVDGNYRIDGKTLIDGQQQTLVSALKNLSGGDFNRPLTITADAGAPYQAVVSVIDSAGSLGFARLHITTQPDAVSNDGGR